LAGTASHLINYQTTKKATMKKAIMILAAILTAITINGQVKGIDFGNAELAETDEELYEHAKQWVKLDYEGENAYTYMIWNDYAVDYKHLITELDRVLKANGLDIDKPDIEDDLLPQNIKGIRDYKNLAYYVTMGEAEISRSYFLDNGWVIGILCNYQGKAIVVANAHSETP